MQTLWYRSVLISHGFKCAFLLTPAAFSGMGAENCIDICVGNLYLFCKTLLPSKPQPSCMQSFTLLRVGLLERYNTSLGLLPVLALSSNKSFGSKMTLRQTFPL